MSTRWIPTLALAAALTGCPDPKPYDDGGAGDVASTPTDARHDRTPADARSDQGDPNTWAMAIPSTGAVATVDLVRDSADNLYLAGQFYNLTTFGQTPLTPADGNDVYVSSVDNKGKVRWVKRFGGAGSELCHRLARDAKGNLYVTGRFTKQISFGATTLTSKGSYDVFFAKLDPAGKPLWASSGGSKYEDRGQGITADGAGNVYVVGEFNKDATFGKHTLTSRGGIDLFVAKLDAGGSYSWIKTAGGTRVDRALAAAATPDGKLFVTGQINGEATFGAAKFKPKNTYHDAFVARYSPSGSVVWVRGAGGLGTDVGQNIAVDSAGNSYITGVFEKVGTFGTLEVSSRGFRDVFAARLDAAGTFVWAASGGGSGLDQGVGLSLDKAGNTYITGVFQSSSATFGSVTLKRAGGEDAFVARVNKKGAFDWAVAAGGTYLEGGNGVVMGGDGYLRAAGYFRSETASFGVHSLNLDKSQPYAVYVWKLAVK